MPTTPVPVHYVLPAVPPSGCRAGGLEILVCGRRPSVRERLPRLEPLPEAGLPKAKLALPGGGRAAVEAQAKELAPGLTSNRVMVSLKWPF